MIGYHYFILFLTVSLQTKRLHFLILKGTETNSETKPSSVSSPSRKQRAAAALGPSASLQTTGADTKGAPGNKPQTVSSVKNKTHFFIYFFCLPSIWYHFKLPLMDFEKKNKSQRRQVSANKQIKRESTIIASQRRASVSAEDKWVVPLLVLLWWCYSDGMLTRPVSVCSENRPAQCGSGNITHTCKLILMILVEPNTHIYARVHTHSHTHTHTNTHHLY